MLIQSTCTTLLRTNISPFKGTFEGDFPFAEVGYLSFPEGRFQDDFHSTKLVDLRPLFLRHPKWQVDEWLHHTVDGRNPAPVDMLIYSIMVSYMSGDMSGGARFLPSTVCLQNVTSCFVITFQTHLAPSPLSSCVISAGLFCRFCAGANQLFSRVQCPRTCGEGVTGGALCATHVPHKFRVTCDVWLLVTYIKQQGGIHHCGIYKPVNTWNLGLPSIYFDCSGCHDWLDGLEILFVSPYLGKWSQIWRAHIF